MSFHTATTKRTSMTSFKYLLIVYWLYSILYFYMQTMNEEKSLAQTYRLEQIKTIIVEIEQERDKRASLIKNYNRGNMAINVIQTILAFGVIGIGAASTVIGNAGEIPIIVIGVLSVAGNQIGKHLTKK